MRRSKEETSKIVSDFYFALSALLILKMFKFLFSLFGHAEKRLDKKDKIDFKIYDVTTW